MHIAVMKERHTKQADSMQGLAVSVHSACYDGRSAPFWFSHQEQQPQSVCTLSFAAIVVIGSGEEMQMT